MPRTIWKYRLKITRSQIIDLPSRHKILAVQVQNGVPVLWAMVNSDKELVRILIYCLPTGDEGPPPEWEYISTIQLEGTVWHFFS